MELSDFASERRPLRCSRLPQFMSCAWATVMQFLDLHSREGGSAAQTGSAMHLAVSEFHKGKEVEKAIAAMNKAREQFPLADFAEAARLFRSYANDERNATAKVVHAEQLVQAEVEPGIFLEGTLDQVREVERGWEVWDVKTSKFFGPLIRDQHTYQVAAYAVLASKRFRRPVHPGGIIMARGYDKGAGNVFYPYNLTFDDAKRLMRNVADRVRDVREGRLQLVPGDQCGYCIGVTNCVAKLRAFESAL